MNCCVVWRKLSDFSRKHILPSIIKHSLSTFPSFLTLRTHYITDVSSIIMKLYNHLHIYITHVMLTVGLYIHKGQFYNRNHGNIFSNKSTALLLGLFILHAYLEITPALLQVHNLSIRDNQSLYRYCYTAGSGMVLTVAFGCFQTLTCFHKYVTSHGCKVSLEWL